MRSVVNRIVMVGLLMLSAGVAEAQQKKTIAIPGFRLQQAQQRAASVMPHVPDNTVFFAAGKPSALLNSAALKDWVSFAKAEDLRSQLLDQGIAMFGLQLDQIDEVAVVIDEKEATRIEEAIAAQTARAASLNPLKQVGLAMHNFHDVHNKFTGTGGPDPDKANLSWRVHLLPYLEQGELYEQFHFDEPWDSKHNRTLIEKMPDIFSTPGVTKKGYTSMHLLSGKGLPFENSEPRSIRDVIDGTSNTLMVVNAGADKATPWTQPVGLDVDLDAPNASLGNVGDQFAVVMMDGYARFLKKDIDATQLRRLMQHNDGEILDELEYVPPVSPPEPTLIVASRTPIDTTKLFAIMAPGVEKPKTVEVAGARGIVLPDVIAVVDGQTLLIGPQVAVTRCLDKAKRTSAQYQHISELMTSNDLVVVADAALLQKIAERDIRQMPMAGVIQGIQAIELKADLTGQSPSVLNGTITLSQPVGAQQLAAVLTGGLTMVRSQIMTMAAQSGADQQFEAGITILTDLIDSATIEADGKVVSLDIPRPGPDTKFIETLREPFAEFANGVRVAREAALKSQQLTPLKQMALAMHNYHDTFNYFPCVEGPGDPDRPNGQGLSWRVHLLPYLEEANLYNQFRFDEPWDSEHNKALIPLMPAIFKSEGVTEPGMTAYHLFGGDAAPFGAKRGPRLASMTDGTSNTLMIVRAGADTAAVWTKPGGLEYDPENPLACLGKFGESLLVAFCDGSARFLPATIDGKTLRYMIEHQDGQLIEIPE